MCRQNLQDAAQRMKDAAGADGVDAQRAASLDFARRAVFSSRDNQRREGVAILRDLVKEQFRASETGYYLVVGLMGIGAWREARVQLGSLCVADPSNTKFEALLQIFLQRQSNKGYLGLITGPLLVVGGLLLASGLLYFAFGRGSSAGRSTAAATSAVAAADAFSSAGSAGASAPSGWRGSSGSTGMSSGSGYEGRLSFGNRQR